METPQKYAESILDVLQDADSNTAYTALDIAKLLLSHRNHALLDFEREALLDSGSDGG